MIAVALLAMLAVAQADEPPSGEPAAVTGGAALTPSEVPVNVSAPSAASTAMDLAMRTYFDGELGASRVAMVLGAASVATGVALFVSGGETRRGFAFPTAIIGLVELAIGIGLQVRTPPQVERLSAQLSSDPKAYVEAERTRMARVNRNWPIFRAVEVGIGVAGIVVAGAGGVTDTATALGVGLGMLTQAVLVLVFDYFAETRGHAYEAALLSFKPN